MVLDWKVTSQTRLGSLSYSEWAEMLKRRDKKSLSNRVAECHADMILVRLHVVIHWHAINYCRSGARCLNLSEV